MMRKQPNILVVEDDTAWQKIMAHVLGEHGYNVVVADNLMVALFCAGLDDIDLAILDWELGAFHAHEAEDFFIKRNIPYFYYSAHDERTIRKHTGAHVLRKKPCDYAELLDTVACVFYIEAAVK